MTGHGPVIHQVMYQWRLRALCARACVCVCAVTQLLNGNLHGDLVSTGKAAHPFVYGYLVFTGEAGLSVSLEYPSQIIGEVQLELWVPRPSLMTHGTASCRILVLLQTICLH